MKEIQLTKGQVALVDDEDFERVNAFKWYAHWSRNTQSYYATRKTTRPNQKHVYMHRFIMETPESLVCDHVDGNTLNNRKNNLRNCTKSENQINRSGQKNNKIGLKGISWNVSKKRYIAQIQVNGKTVFRKEFKDIEKAKEAYEKASIQYHGEFRRLKYIDI